MKRSIARSETIRAKTRGGDAIAAASVIDANQIPQTYAWLQWPCQ
ncbi:MULTISPECIES: hypothetical protein [Burkholderia]|nr:MULTISPECIES: hypothetical protein [Burkholderia]KGS00086.1 hypothetical protein X946_3934 [Burkholderia sp. ABCPW 111]